MQFDRVAKPKRSSVQSRVRADDADVCFGKQCDVRMRRSRARCLCTYGDISLCGRLSSSQRCRVVVQMSLENVERRMQRNFHWPSWVNGHRFYLLDYSFI